MYATHYRTINYISIQFFQNGIALSVLCPVSKGVGSPAKRRGDTFPQGQSQYSRNMIDCKGEIGRSHQNLRTSSAEFKHLCRGRILRTRLRIIDKRCCATKPRFRSFSRIVNLFRINLSPGDRWYRCRCHQQVFP